ncbi:DUF3168 domain-containing protein [Devosia sp.]|uniref:tail completion protein gp17 n=1 Tax=Devosia sp. TaxID=1871048 RepID=UPI001ACD881B|nr:DUF3168 domain-containing protein [Devosia sp.]MBN9333862.1 DUF3168 domain-containing protein [Devosia sp.]
MADIVTAIVGLLKADADIAALVGDRVFGGELPADEARHMPRQAIVIQPSGGAPFQPRASLRAEAQRLDLICYGATPGEAMELRNLGAHAFKRVRRQTAAGVLIHWVNSAGGYMAGRDRDGQWPYAFQSFQSLFSLSLDEVA